MKRPALLSLPALLLLAAVPAWRLAAETNKVSFPADLDALVHYTTVTRGTTVEEMLTTPDAIAAVKAGRPVPNGTHFVLVEHRNGELYRYFVMEKGEGFGTDYQPRRRTGDWQFQWFTPAKTVNLDENTARCQSCHFSAAGNDFLFTTSTLK